ncbi:hypothetical protein Hypma_003839 [Hypsizygus marmoreus]|uniref:Uncharacterized protein n=1 Tax=Hypsizygus marmoreus TaxID=39966 RepID=A0A369K431_HYPMA|nr:hypothetical protein Hypma_003839 [Hypsizygus marmoreus]
MTASPNPDSSGLLHPEEHISPEVYKSLAEQFGTLVIISTFTASLIVAFLSLAHDVIADNPSPVATMHLEIGLLLALSATGVHLGVIVVGGRAAALCFRLAAVARSPSQVEANIIADFKDINFYRYITYCNRLQLIGAMLLLSSFLFLTFSLFSHHAFFWVLLGASILGGFSIFRIGFWKASVTRENVKAAWGRLTRRMTRKAR